MPAKERPDRDVQEQPGDNIKYTAHNLVLLSWKRPDMSDTDAVQQRVYDYFNLCAQNDMRPSVEGLSLAFNTDRKTMWRWVNGADSKYMSDDTRHVLKMAYSLLNAQMADYMQNNRVNAVAGIFLMKNHFGYEDKTEVIVQPGPYDALPDADKLAQEYIDAVTVPAKELAEKSSQNNTENAENVNNLAQEYTADNG